MVSLKTVQNAEGDFHSGEVDLVELRLALELERGRAITTVWEAIRAAHYDDELDNQQRAALIEKLRKAMSELQAIDSEALSGPDDLKFATQQVTLILTRNF